MHLAFNAVSAGLTSFDSIVELPPESWARNQEPRSSLMFLAQGQIVTLRELLLGLAIPSGNDAAVAVAFHVGGSLPSFVAMMNAEAARMGLSASVFVEPSGISEFNMTTARDFAYFCRHYVKLHPEALSDFHSVPLLAYPTADNLPEYMRARPRTIVQYNHIPLMGSVPGVDGLKTGYIDEAGYNAASTAQRDGTRFIAVVLGVPKEMGAIWGPRAREADCRALLTWAFDNYKTIRPPPPEIPQVRVYKGKRNNMGLFFNTIALTVAADRALGETADLQSVDLQSAALRWEVSVASPVIAPVYKGDVLGTATLFDAKGVITDIPLTAVEDVPRGSWLKRAWDSFLLVFVR
jgi:D-alanyl-D-alanine carboxypeptidase (penicillin-binding protein 5/6)